MIQRRFTLTTVLGFVIILFLIKSGTMTKAQHNPVRPEQHQATEITELNYYPGQRGGLIYFNDFEGIVGSEWSRNTTDVTPVGARRFLGQFSNETVNLTLNDLPSHEALTISFDLFLINSWDGNETGDVGPDIWSLDVDNNPLLYTTFSNLDEFDWWQAYPETYPDGNYPPYTGAVEIDTLGYNYYGSSVYRLTFAFSHSASSLVVSFMASGLQDISDESWGLDNVRVNTTIQPPIILLPGIMGSRLVNNPLTSGGCSRPGGEIWPNIPYILLDFQTRRLQSLWLQDNGQQPANECDQVQPTAVFTDFSIDVNIPGIGPFTYEADFYQQFIADMNYAGYSVYPFAYDWRLDLEQIAQNLDNYISTSVGTTPVILVGHSLGGLVARQYTLNPVRAQNVEKVITVGTPYWGTPETALHMRKGTIPVNYFNPSLRNDDVRTFHRNSPAVMQILPSEAFFQQYGYYFMANTDFLTSYPQTTQYFETNGQNPFLLTQAETRHDNIDDFRQNLTVPYYVLTANHRSDAVGTVREYNCWWSLDGKCWDDSRYVIGDGTVPWVSARLQGLAGDWSGNAEICTFTTLSQSHDHGTLLSDDVVIDDIKLLLQGLATQSCLPATESLPHQSNGSDGLVQLVIWGNATAMVTDPLGNFAAVSDEGLVFNTIPGSSYDASEGNSIIVLPAGATYSVTLYQQGTEPVQLNITDFQADPSGEVFDPHERALFVNVPSAPGGEATMTLDLTGGLSVLELALDLDGDGTPEQILPPTSVLDEQGIQDLTPPTTAINIQGNQDDWGFYTGIVQATVSASDSEIGVLESEYSLDGGQTWQIYTEPVIFVAEQVPVFAARSMDRAGNQEYPWPVRRLRPYALFLPVAQR